MKAISRIALAVSLALAGGGLALAPALAAKKDQAKPVEVSQAVGENLNAAQEAIQKKDFATAQAKLSAAEAAVKTAGDRYNVGIVKFNLGQNTKNEQLQSQGVDQAIASGLASPDQLKQLLNVQGVIAYNAKDYPKAVAAFGRAYELDPNGEGNLTNLIQAQTAAGQTAAANETMTKAMASAKASGKPVPEALLKRQIAMSVNARGAVPIAVLIELVSSYPNPTNWRDCLIIYRDANKADAILSLD
jgi:tetratricopeptide (TPR) repeat protein